MHGSVQTEIFLALEASTAFVRAVPSETCETPNSI